MRTLLNEDHDQAAVRTDALDLEGQMRKVSQVVSAAAVGLMLAGLLASIGAGSGLTLPGSSVMALHDLLKLPVHPLGLAAMSAGIILLALLPVVRVLLALALYTRRRAPVDAVAALVVFVELLVSMRAGGG